MIIASDDIAILLNEHGRIIDMQLLRAPVRPDASPAGPAPTPPAPAPAPNEE